MNKTAWVTLLLLALTLPCPAQDEKEPPGEGDEGWREDGEGRDPGHEREHPNRDMREPREPREGMEGREGEGRNGPRPPNPPMPPRQLSDEEVAEVLEFLRGWDPYRVQRLEQFRERNPHDYMRTLQESYFEMKRVQEMQKSNPEAFEEMKKERGLEMQSFQLGEQIRKSEDAAEKDKLKADLKPVLEQLFDVREKHKDQEIARLEEDLKRLKEQVEKRRKNKESVVERRLRELSGEQPDDDW